MVVLSKSEISMFKISECLKTESRGMVGVLYFIQLMTLRLLSIVWMCLDVNPSKFRNVLRYKVNRISTDTYSNLAMLAVEHIPGVSVILF